MKGDNFFEFLAKVKAHLRDSEASDPLFLGGGDLKNFWARSREFPEISWKNDSPGSLDSFDTTGHFVVAGTSRISL